MRLSNIEIEYDRLRDMTTEVFFKVASARASGISVVRFDIKEKGNEGLENKALNFLMKILKGMRRRSAIQFFVTKDGFLKSSTEAQYVLNVFPEVGDDIPQDEGAKFVFVRL